MQQQDAVLRLIRDRLSELQARNPSYSIRAYAKKLGIGVSTASMVLNGHRRVSPKLALRIADRLLLDPVERATAIDPLFPKKATARRRGLGENIKLSADQYQVYSEWYYLAILNLVRLKSFRADPAWIAGRLGLTPTRATEALERLNRLGMLRQNDDGKWVRVKPAYRSTDGVANASVRKSHFQNLDLARRTLEQDDLTSNDFSFLTLTVRASRMEEMKRKIRQFQDDFATDFSYDADADEVYRLNVQLFPLTQTPKPPKGKK